MKKRRTKVIAISILAYLCLIVTIRLWCQLAPIEVVVAVEKPTAPELAAKIGISVENLPETSLEYIPYFSTTNKLVTKKDIREVRRLLVWNGAHVNCASRLEVHSSSNIVAIVPRSRESSDWVICQKTVDGWSLGPVQGAIEDKVQPDLIDRITGFLQQILFL